MRFPGILRLFPFISPPQSSLPPNTNVGSSSRLLPATLGLVLLPQLNSDQILTSLPTKQAIASASPLLGAAIVPRSVAPSLLDPPISRPLLSDGTSKITEAAPSASDVCQGLIEDLDITGLGVRITFYVTSILTVINACIPGCDARGSSWATLFTFIALMVSAIVQAANRSISLYNVVIVLYLCFLHLICALTLILGAMLKKTFGAPAPDFGLGTMFVFSLPHWSWHIFGLYVWAHASSFGSQPECNPATKLIVFGRELSATGSGRVVSLVFFSLSATVVLSVPVITITGVGVLILLAAITMRPLIRSYTRRLSVGSGEKPRTFYNRIVFTNLYLTLCFIIQWVYVVVTIEQTIQRNQVIHDGSRFPVTFGQIFPVVTIGACIVSIYNDVQESRRAPPIEAAKEPEDSKVPVKEDV